MRKESEMGCKSPEHQPDCPCPRCEKPPEKCNHCPNLNVQHEIPKCIGKKILGMTSNELDKYSHPESKVDHSFNDKNVTMVFQEMLIMRRKEHIVFTKEDVLTMRNDHIFSANRRLI
jgi:hypothetical protein